MTGVNELATQALTGLLEIINKGLDVAPQYVVDLIHRYGMFYGFANLLGVLVSGTVIFLLVYYGIRGIKEEEEYGVPLVLFSLLALVPFILCTIGMLKAFIVPEMVMIDALQGCGSCR